VRWQPRICQTNCRRDLLRGSGAARDDSLDATRVRLDDHTVAEGWSVIVKGTAHQLSANADILDAQEAPLRPWIATLKPLYVRVIASEITGRRFKFGPEPDHETIIG